MNKVDFLRKLNQELGILDQEEKAEIIAFYEERFYSGTVYENKTEEEVISELESPEVIAKNVLEVYGASPKYVKTKAERYTGISSGKLFFLILFDIFIASWLIPTLYSIVVAVFGSLLSYVSVIRIMFETHSIADEFLFAFVTGAYILLFIFGLLILELTIYVTKKILIYHMNVLKFKNREKISKKLHRISVEGWFKRHKVFSSIKSILFLGAIVTMTYSGYHLFIKEDRLISAYTDSELTTEKYSLDLQNDIDALEPWDIIVNSETLGVKIVPITGTEVNVIYEYYKDYDFVLEIDESTNTITVENYAPDRINIGDIRDLFLFFRNDELVTIEVPVDLIVNDINLDSVNGTINVEDLDISLLEVYTENGKISIDGVSVQEDVILYTSNGEINVQDVIGKYTLTAITSNGKIYLRNTEFLEYYLDTSNGVIDLANLNVIDQDGVILSADTSNGDIILADVYVEDITLGTSNGDIEFYNSDLAFIIGNLDTDTSNGDISTNVN